MTFKALGYTGTVLDTDTSGNLYVDVGNPGLYPSRGGGYFMASGQGGAGGVVAAALAASSSLMSFRASPLATVNTYIDRIRVYTSVSTIGASGGVAGVLAVQRFGSATPSGGTARVAIRRNPALSFASAADIRDNNAALTVTGVTFGDVVASNVVPLYTVGGQVCLLYEFFKQDVPGVLGNLNVPLLLQPGDGIALRTQVAMAATQTWHYNYTIYWHEGP